MKPEELFAMMVPQESFRGMRTKRRRPYVTETVLPKMVPAFLEDGWEVDRENKKSTRMRRLKAPDALFEDTIWTMLADLGFTRLNRDRNFVMKYGKGDSDTRQVDVFAADDETVLIVECKATTGEFKKASFKSEIEALTGIRAGLINSARGAFPNHKVKVIFATSRYIVGPSDTERMADAGIEHFDDDAVEYYQELTKHLGPAARFQLLGRLFAGTKIPGMPNRVPAIQGRMGGHRYYAFSIEPEKLLKIGYVLHRSEANVNSMPTYQRLIKRARLRSVAAFVEAGNFFPNSIIINIDGSKRGPKFDRAKMPLENASTRIGILHLPQNYQSAYIIDGQHRLYGFAATELAKTETIPVVAFVNLDQIEQVRLFMDIKENQKAVPRNLQNTLNAGIDWDSEDLVRRNRALILRVAQDLGERKQSPLAGRVIVGENKATRLRCITMETIKVGLDRGRFFGRFKPTEIDEAGTFYKGSNAATKKVVLPFLEDCFRHLRDEPPEQWELGSADGGFVFINAGVQSLLRLLSDVVDHLVENEGINPKTSPTADLVDYLAYYLTPAIRFLRELPADEAADLKGRFGSGGYIPYWRSLQRAVHEEFSEFEPQGMLEWWADRAESDNDAARELVRKVEESMNRDFRKRLEAEYGDACLKKGLPFSVYTSVMQRAAEKSFDRPDDVDPWSALNLIDYQKILRKDAAQWDKLFAERYTIPGAPKPGGREAKTKWISRLNKIRNDLAHITHYVVSDDDYDFLKSLGGWLLEGNYAKPG